MLVGYVRVSKNDGSQTLDLQMDALTAARVRTDYIYKDLASGRKDNRPGLHACLKALQPGNTLVVWKLDRLGRDLKDLVNLIDDLRQRQIGFKVLAGHGAQIDTSTANGRLVFGIFATLAEFERELINANSLVNAHERDWPRREPEAAKGGDPEKWINGRYKWRWRLWPTHKLLQPR